MRKAAYFRSCRVLKAQVSWQHQSIELILKRNRTLCLVGHWFQPGQRSNRFKTSPCCGQHNMASREQQVSWPHSDTIKKERKLTETTTPVEWYIFFEASVSFSTEVPREWQGEQITMKYILVSFGTFNVFRAAAGTACKLTACCDCASPL